MRALIARILRRLAGAADRAAARIELRIAEREIVEMAKRRWP